MSKTAAKAGDVDKLRQQMMQVKNVVCLALSDL